MDTRNYELEAAFETIRDHRYHESQRILDVLYRNTAVEFQARVYERVIQLVKQELEDQKNRGCWVGVKND